MMTDLLNAFNNLTEDHQWWVFIIFVVGVLLIILLIGIFSVIRGLKQNREIKILGWLVWMSAPKSAPETTINPAVIKETQSFLENAHEDIEQLRVEILAEINRLNDKEMELTNQPDTISGTTKYIQLKPAITSVQNNRNQLKQEIVTRLDELKKDCNKIATSLEKALNNTNL